MQHALGQRRWHEGDADFLFHQPVAQSLGFGANEIRHKMQARSSR